MYNCCCDIPSCVLIRVLISSNGQLVCVDKVEKSNGPKLFNDVIEEWPNYIRLVLPILNIPLGKKKEKSTSPVVQSTNCIQPEIAGLVTHYQFVVCTCG